MKFGKALISNQRPEWANHYLAYKALKNHVSTIVDKTITLEAGNGAEDAITAFFFALDRELKKVNDFFNYKCAENERRYRILAERCRNVLFPKRILVEALNDLREQILRLLEFAKINREGFRKILKKYDKRCQKSAQDAYLSTKVDTLPFADETVFNMILEDIDSLTKGLELELATVSPVDVKNPTPNLDDHAILEQLMHFLDKDLYLDLDNYLSPDDGIPVVNVSEDHLVHVIMLAAIIGSKACLKVLLDFSSKPERADVLFERTLLHYVAISCMKNAEEFSGKIAKVVHAIAHEAPALVPSLTKSDVFGRSPLHYACMSGNVELVKACLELFNSFNLKISTSWRDSEGHSPLFYSVIKNFSQIVSQLLDFDGVNVDDVYIAPSDCPSQFPVISSSPTTSMYLAASYPAKSTGQSQTPLLLACKFGCFETAKLLLERGANVDFVDDDGESPLHLASRGGHINCTKLLCQPSLFVVNAKKTDVDLQEHLYGWTPLMVAAVEGHKECVEILTDMKAELSIRDFSGWTAHDHAVFRGHMDIARILYGFTDPQFPTPMVPNAVPKSGNRIPAATKFYGHGYLKDKVMFLITPGVCDSKFPLPPVTFIKPYPFVGSSAKDASLATFSSASQAISLVVKPINCAGENAIFDLPVKEAYEPVIFFADADADDLVLRFEIVATYGSRKGPAARAISSIGREIFRNSFTSSRVRMMSAPLITEHFEVVGKVHFEVTVVTPFMHPNLTISSKQTYWKSVETKVIGHRGAGANRQFTGGRGNLQIGENSVLSLITAASLGAEYVEFDVQMTRDMVPVIYHDFILSETGMKIPVSAVSLDEFQQLGPRDNRKSRRSRESSKSKACGSLSDDPDISNNRSARVFSLSSLDAINHRHEFDELRSNPRSRHHGGRGDVAIKAPFATLEETLKAVPVNVGFNIEVKYPNTNECEEFGIKDTDPNIFIDRILEVVYSHAGERSIIFSSFHPDACLMLNAKQPNYPVFFLTEGGTCKMYDPRCNSLQAAIRFAKFADLLGIVTLSDPVIDAPKLISTIKEQGLLLFTYGGLNNDVEKVELQRRLGVDAVIVDRIMPIVRSLRPKQI